MASEQYRRKINAFTLTVAAAFAGGNLFIGLSMGTYWLSLEPSLFYETFFFQWLRFLYTIMPLFILLLIGLILCARMDWQEPGLRRRWLIGIGLYLLVTLITSIVHLPINLRIGTTVLSEADGQASNWLGLISMFGEASHSSASEVRSTWLLMHIPRILATMLIPFIIFGAISQRGTQPDSAS
ncbi:MAG: hypothetical protein AAGB19_14140 [Cyanobacteria bacterium P01_F01_bin.3]